MLLTSGTRLGPYEIIAALGAGGMGEVYRARDTKLAREVAIKVLPAEVSADPSRLARFEQEARSASALNHPNIVTIYEIGRAESVSYISMELVQGKTLRELLVEGPLPSKRLLALSAQVADGLARAHAAGIVHRDLKPDNVMVTREGLVKILDFGLAKLVGTSDPGMSQLPTVAERTAPGVVLGTVGYMSPEQAMGRQVDFRSDQFSLGSILYEMATGKRAFSRDTAPETLAAIIREEPEPLPHLAPGIPAALRWAIERCLAKEPEDRYGSTRDLARDLAQLRDHSSEIAPPALARRRPGWLATAWVSSIVLVAALGIFIGLQRRKEPAASPLRFTVAVPAGVGTPGSTSSRLTGVRVSISPDGTRLGIEGFSKGQRRLYVRPLDADDAVELPGTIGAAGHFWSPDSRHLAFWADGKLKKIAIDGGPPVDLGEVVLQTPGAWARDGTILFPNRAVSPSGLFRIPESGGQAERVTACGPTEENHRGPSFLSDGRRFLYFVNSMPGAADTRELRLGTLDSSETRTVMRMDCRAEYSPLGYLVYSREGALFAQRFDEKTVRLIGEPLLLADDVNYFLNTGDAAFSLSQTNVLVYRTAPSAQRMAWVRRDGTEAGQLGPPLLSGAFRISPDGQRIAVGIRDQKTGTSDIWLIESGSGISTRLNSDNASELIPVWTHDGSRLLYGSDRRGPPDIYMMSMAESPGAEKPLLEQAGYQQPEDISRDGRLVAYTEAWPNRDIWLMPLDDGGQPAPWARTRFTESSPRFSPDGRWIAYESDESGETEIFVAQTEGGGGRRRISPTGGRQPRWRADGRELYYIGPGDLIMAAEVTPGARMEAGVPVALFRAQGVANYDVAADGSRFLVGTPTDPDRESQLHVIVNWTAALGRHK
jgi:serine/threonine protein kinase